MTDDVKLYQILGKKEPVKGDVGVEIEVETKTAMYDANIPCGWKPVREGSLRNNGIEFVMTKAFNIDVAKAKIKDMTACIEKHGPIESRRTSVHVHMNVQEYSPKKIWAIITCMWLLEDLISEYAGVDRKGNLFCLRASDASNIIKLASSDVSAKNHHKAFSYFGAENSKYCGLNLANILKFGTLENRLMRGTNNPEAIIMWMNMLHHVKSKAVELFDSPIDVFDTFWVEGTKDWVKKLMPDDFMKFIETVPEWVEIVDDSCDLVVNFPYEVDWDIYQSNINKITRGKDNIPNDLGFNVEPGAVVRQAQPRFVFEQVAQVPDDF